MIRHVFLLAWQRKRANARLILELLLVFLVLFSLAGFGLHLLRLYRMPLGFEYADTWAANVEPRGKWEEARDEVTLQQLMTAVQGLGEVEAVYLRGMPPFIPKHGATMDSVDGTQLSWVMDFASDGMLEALGTQLVEGRWYGPQDEGQNYTAVVVNRHFRDAVTELGADLESFNAEGDRIVGVIEDFRLDGEFAAPVPIMISRVNVGTEGSLLQFSQGFSLTVLVKPGVTAAFEEDLLEVMHGVAPLWDVEVRSWESLRADHIREYTLPLLLGGIIATFLVILVGCGLLGVLWQNVIRRMPEMGLRRAVGASAGAVRLQVVLELVALACIALVLGSIIVVQLPLSGMVQALDWGLFITALITSTLTLLGLCVLFALYPSYQATRRDPVAALRHE